MTPEDEQARRDEQVRLMKNFDRAWSDVEVCPTCKGVGIQVHDNIPRIRTCVICVGHGRVTRLTTTKLAPFIPATNT